MNSKNEYTLDYLLNYCEDSALDTSEVMVTITNEELLTDIQEYHKQVIENILDTSVGY